MSECTDTNPAAAKAEEALNDAIQEYLNACVPGKYVNGWNIVAQVTDGEHQVPAVFAPHGQSSALSYGLAKVGFQARKQLLKAQGPADYDQE